MLPISEIKIGNNFKNPIFSDGVIFSVEEVNKKEKMIKVQGYSYKDLNPVSKPFWKRNTDRMFSESWRF